MAASTWPIYVLIIADPFQNNGKKKHCHFGNLKTVFFVLYNCVLIYVGVISNLQEFASIAQATPICPLSFSYVYTYIERKTYVCVYMYMYVWEIKKTRLFTSFRDGFPTNVVFLFHDPCTGIIIRECSVDTTQFPNPQSASVFLKPLLKKQVWNKDDKCTSQPN